MEGKSVLLFAIKIQILAEANLIRPSYSDTTAKCLLVIPHYLETICATIDYAVSVV